MKRRRLERLKYARIAKAVAQGESIALALAREGVEQRHYEAWFRNYGHMWFPDEGQTHPWIVRTIFAALILCVVAGLLKWLALGAIGWLLLSCALLARTIDSIRRGVDRNWNTGRVLRFEEHPIAFVLGMLLCGVIELLFLTFGMHSLAAALGWL